MSEPLTVLCVEDSRLFRKTVAKHCSVLGLECREVDSVIAALEVVRERSPVGVVAGNELRDFPASSLVAALRSDPRCSGMPIAVMSSSAKDGIVGVYQPDVLLRRDETLQQGLCDYLKPLAAARSREQEEAPHVLLVEDSATIQRLAARMLHLAGLQVTMVAHGEDALKALDAGTFDLVLMDIEMPVMDGRETIMRMRMSKDETPVVALTGHERSYFEAEARQLGFTDLCSKPLRKDALLTTLSTHLPGHNSAF
ncbi:MAG: response regulator [Planctomycetota bacterium]